MKELMGFTSSALSVDSEVRGLSGGEKQGVAIARALHFQADLIILDEPTTCLLYTSIGNSFYASEEREYICDWGIRWRQVEYETPFGVGHYCLLYTSRCV